MNKFYSLYQKIVINNLKLSACYTFKGLKIKVDKLEAGDIIAVAGIENINIGDTISSNEDPKLFLELKLTNQQYQCFSM